MNFLIQWRLPAVWFAGVLATMAAAPGAWAASESVLYSFKGAPGDGATPYGGLLYSGGVLYGTTQEGGSGTVYACTFFRTGCGTAFSLTLDGTETVLHNFGLTQSDGVVPSSALLDVGGTFYGLTLQGGTGNYLGTVFKMTPDGTESVLYQFGGAKKKPDGNSPSGSLTKVGKVLYGTTSAGPYDPSYGTVFSVTLGGKETILHAFTADPDGASPYTGMLNIGGTFYGVTEAGGGGRGSLYKIDPSGTETVLHGFRGSKSDFPSYLINVGKTLYGATGQEGIPGTIFKATTGGKITTIYTFSGGADGSAPNCLLSLGGVLYGTTGFGGAYGYGTVFEMTAAGDETVLYSFQGGSDGAQPNSLINIGGTFYGTTAYGGAANAGTVFKLTP